MSSDTLASVSSPSVVNAVVGGSFAGPVPGPGRRWPASSLPRPSQPRPGGQPSETMAVRPDLQPGQLYEKAGVAGGYEALDSEQSSDQADQDGWATGTPRKEAGVSACRGAGNQGNADRDTSRLLINGSPADRSGNSLKTPTISEVVESSLYVNVHSCYADAPFR